MDNRAMAGWVAIIGVLVLGWVLWATGAFHDEAGTEPATSEQPYTPPAAPSAPSETSPAE